MKKVKNNLPQAESLRQIAEDQLSGMHALDASSLSEADILKMWHELRVHQIELEMQNEELHLAITKAEIASQEYSQLYEEIYDFSPAAYFALNHDCAICKLNLSGAKLLGGDRKNLLENSFRFYISHDSQQVFNNFLQNIVETNVKQCCEVTLTSEGNPGHYVHLEGIVPDYGQKYLISAVDITPLKLAEEALSVSETRLRDLNATKDKFFSIIAHDLKSPFNSIKGGSRFLLNEYENLTKTEIREYIEQIYNGSSNSLKLLDDLLQWAESQTGIISVSLEKVDLALLVNDTIESLISTAGGKNISIQSSVKNKCFVIADKFMLRTIMRNLVGNAIKFTFEGGIIDITAQADENEVVINVIDNGTGFRAADLENLFKMDHKIITSGTAKEKGTGLGLILCKEFIEKQFGRIWVESELGKGSAIHFALPKG